MNCKERLLKNGLPATPIDLIRRQNLFIAFRQFAREHLAFDGSLASIHTSFALKLDITPFTLHNRLFKAIFITDDLAMQIECRLNETLGWLDQPRIEEKSWLEISEEMLAYEALAKLRTLSEEEQLALISAIRSL